MIILVAVGTGSSKAVQDQISSLGSNTPHRHRVLDQQRWARRWAGGGGGGFPFPGLGGGTEEDTTSQNATKTKEPLLTIEDARAIAESDEAPHVLGSPRW